MAITFVLFLTLLVNSFATHCDKELDYHDNYGYGIDITCEDLSNDNEKMLKNVSVSNEIVLSIKNSNLTKVTPDLFYNVPKIRYLSIVNSTFSFDPNEKVFANFAKLEHLSVSNTKFNNLNSHVLTGLDDLRELSLRNCSLSTIKNETFAMLKKLEALKLPNNHFRSMFNIPFCELPSLKFVDLDHNEIQQIEDSFLVCFEKEEESGFMLNGREHEIYHNTNFHQTKSSFNIIELNLGHNQISNVRSFDWCAGLKYLDLSTNRLRNITHNIFNMLNELEKLNLENNLIENVDKDGFAKLQNLKFINLENNTLSEISLINLVNLEEVNLSRNRLVSNSLTNLRNLTKVHNLILSYNEIDNLPRSMFKNFPSLSFLDLSSNKLLLSQECFMDLSNLEQLNICNNGLQVIPSTTFNKLSNLQVLDISANKLGPILDDQTFIGLDSLEILNVSNNLLQYLNYHLLEPLRNLQVLDISGNRLQTFQINLISLLPSLRVINIKSNLLSCSTLSTIITFLKSKEISYTIHEEFEYDRQNVEGIYCEEISAKLLKIEDRGVNLATVVGFMFLIVVASICFSFVFYKCLLYARRQRYRMDELELL